MKHVGFINDDKNPTYWVLTQTSLLIYPFMSKELEEKGEDVGDSLIDIGIDEIISANIRKVEGELSKLIIIAKKDQKVDLLGSQKILKQWDDEILFRIMKITKSQTTSLLTKLPNIMNYSLYYLLEIFHVSLPVQVNMCIRISNATQHHWVTPKCEGVNKREYDVLYTLSTNFYMASSTYVKLRIYNIPNDHNKKKSQIGKCIISLNPTAHDEPYESVFQLKKGNKEIGKLFTRISFFQMPPNSERTRKVAKRYEVHQTYTTPSRSKFLIHSKPSPPCDIKLESQFCGFCAVNIYDIKQDLEYYFCSEKVTYDNIVDIPFSGLVSFKYPCDDDLIPESVWMLCFTEGMRVKRKHENFEVVSFVLTNSKGNYLHGVGLISYAKMTEDMKNEVRRWVEAEGDYYVPQAICVFSRVNCYVQMREFVEKIHTKSALELFCEKVQSTPKVFEDFTKCKPSATKEGMMHEIQYDIIHLFISLKIKNFVKAFGQVLLGERVVVVGDTCDIVAETLECLKTVIYPIEWVSTYNMNLQRFFIESLHSPSLYLIGIVRKYLSEAIGIMREEDVVIVDIEKNKVQKVSGKPLLELPYHLEQNLVNDIMSVINSSYCKNDIVLRNTLLQRSFLRAMCYLLSGLEKYFWTLKFEPESIEEFNSEEFVTTKPDDYYEFLKTFFQSQNTQFFLEQYNKKRYILFDEYVRSGRYVIPVLQGYEMEEQGSSIQIPEIQKVTKGSTFIRDFVNHNNHKTKQIRMDCIENVVQSREERLLFLQSLISKKVELKRNRECYVLDEIEMCWMTEVLLKICETAARENDIISLKYVVLFCEEMTYKNGFEELLFVLKRKSYWNNKDLWINITKHLINSNKKLLMEYRMDKTESFPQSFHTQKEFPKISTQCFFACKMMITLEVPEKLIKSIIETVAIQLRLDSFERDQLNQLITNATKPISSFT
ncbi:hypothetical protein EIN_054610 [Entamoeba invadens IP1]|uniref:hypothetical protein n=1 Tax=Entamoeba invadens IP1 TaxID=370355 RepID=UPI0002C3F70A|nr:hypothetical protein EIN_054610 [Entamoeba invadens IP1]ELP93176.1 hypothetical protein EIN_054610 [Entamoeba invadens IP1]|eukprot:XP_004259947.1 hypothetical protein EIN_054610 [Entamoeba invadens IP1]